MARPLLSDELLDGMADDLAGRLTELTKRTYGRFGGAKSMPPDETNLSRHLRRVPTRSEIRESRLVCEVCGRKLAEHGIVESCRLEG